MSALHSSIWTRSLLRRSFVAHLLGLLLFCFFLIGNFIWREEQNISGERDKSLKKVAESLVYLTKSSRFPPATEKQIDSYRMLDQFLQKITEDSNNQVDTNEVFALRITDRTRGVIFTNAYAQMIPININNSNFYDVVVNKDSWRVFKSNATDSPYEVEVAQLRPIARSQLYEIFGIYLLWPLVWSLPLAAFVAWLSSSRGLAPLKTLASNISRRSPGDMNPLRLNLNYRELEPVVSEINGLLTKVDSTLVRERAFLADAAHELRTPLAVIQAQAHVMQHAQTNNERAQASKELTSAIERAATLIRKLLVSAQLSNQDYELNLVRTNLVELVQERISTFAVLAEQSQVEMELSSPTRCEVYLERDLFLSALDNVIDNAIQYSPIGGIITVKVELETSDRIAICVVDQGAGVPDALQKRVLERFFRVPGTGKIGSGLGLAIVDRVMVLHKGSVTLSPGPKNVGLCVRLFLPAK
jgi:signal transduction histidine kinase